MHSCTQISISTISSQQLLTLYTVFITYIALFGHGLLYEMKISVLASEVKSGQCLFALDSLNHKVTAGKQHSYITVLLGFVSASTCVHAPEPDKIICHPSTPIVLFSKNSQQPLLAFKPFVYVIM